MPIVWQVNKEHHHRDIISLINDLCDHIPPPTENQFGAWHGDFFPGNIVIQRGLSYRDELGMVMIDPRATLDGKSLAMHGDKRYDLAKLEHSLRWGYDLLVEGWYDCSWTKSGDKLNVSLDLWDETWQGAISNRIRIWNDLPDVGLTIGVTHAERKVITAMAALQLITAAPLHKDDIKRMVAIVARGIQAANAVIMEE